MPTPFSEGLANTHGIDMKDSPKWVQYLAVASMLTGYILEPGVIIGAVAYNSMSKAPDKK